MSLKLSVGDRVVYPNQGVCRVTAIDVQEVAGQKLTFVRMQREEDGARVMVPEGKVTSIGLRKVATSEEITALFDFLRSDSDKADLDWKLRARTNADRMSAGGIIGLAEVVKGLQVLSELRPLPTKERELYDNARHLLVAEISASLSIQEANAEDAVDIVLFPPGKERPKRTAEEFARPGEDDEGLDLGDDLLALGGELDLPPEEEEKPAEEEASGEEEAGEEEEKPAAAPKKRGRPPKAKPAAAAAKEEDEEETVIGGPALRVAPAPATPPAAPKKRGRPPKPKPAEPAVPKKRGRPPKPKPAEAAPAAPKKRGRPPKAASEKAAPKGKKK